jgi:hypothetical protein
VRKTSRGAGDAPASRTHRAYTVDDGGCRRFYIDHLLFLEDAWYRRLLAWKVGAMLQRGGRMHLSFRCSAGCCELDSARSAADFLLSGRHAKDWLTAA